MWEVAQEWEIWQPYRTPDISDIIEEIIARPGWEPGNSIAIMFKGENQGPSVVENAREWESFENIADPEDGGDGKNHPERVPRLYIFYKGPAAIAEHNSVKQLHIYPNPAYTDQITVSLESDEPADIYMYDITGKMISSQSVNKTSLVSFNISKLTRGIYILKAFQDEQVYIQKLVVQ
jgi:hypothetical protein